MQHPQALPGRSVTCVVRTPLLLLALLGLLRAPATGQESDSERPGLALLVGVSEYPRLRELHENRPGHYEQAIRLNGPANDTSLMAEKLIQVLGFREADIVRLVGEGKQGPTRENIRKGIERLAREVRRGELFVLYLSGHGSQQPDLNGDEGDGLDEIFLPADCGPWNDGVGAVENAIVDDELWGWLEPLRERGARVWLISDSCHSGTMVRGVDQEVRYRALEPSDLLIPADLLAARTRGGGGSGEEIDEASGLVAMYAAQSFQKAPEYPLPREAEREERRSHGLFTFLLARQLVLTQGRTTFQDLHGRVLAAYEAFPYHGARPSAQGELSSFVRGGRAEKPVLSLRSDKGRLVLNAGSVEGIRPETVLAVYRSGQAGEEDGLLGYARVSSVGLTSSECQALEKDGRTLPALEGDELRVCAAEILSEPVSTERLRLCVSAPAGEPVEEADFPEALRRCLEVHADRLVVVPATQAEWRLVLEPERWRLVALQSGSERSYDVAAGALDDVLMRVYRAQNLMRLAANPTSGGIPAGLTVEFLVDGETLSLESPIRPGTKAVLHLQNSTERSLDVWVFAMTQDLEIGQLFPNSGLKSPNLSPQEREKRVKLLFTDESLGEEHLIVLTVPPGSGDFTWLAQPPLERTRTRGGTGGAFGELLESMTFGTRGPRLVPEKAEGTVGLVRYSVGWDSVPEGKQRSASGLRTGQVGASTQVEHGRGKGELGALAADEARQRGDLTGVFARVAPAVFAVLTSTGHGTGFLVDAQGLVLTNHHVVADGFEYSRDGRPLVRLARGVLQPDGTMRVLDEPVPAVLVHQDARRDLALLRIVGAPAWLGEVAPIPLAEGEPAPGLECIMVGNPRSGLLWTVRSGHVAGIGREPADMTQFAVPRLVLGMRSSQEAGKNLADASSPAPDWEGPESVRIVMSSCWANPGDSGGPLVDVQGRLIGVTHAIPFEERDDKFVYHVHLSEVRAFLDARPPRAAEALPSPPDAWQLGPNVVPGSTGVEAGFDVLAGGGAPDGELVPSRFLLDVDRASGARLPESARELRELLEARRFDAEIALHFELDRRVAFYDRDDDGSFDLVLVDVDEDPNADCRFELAGGRWSFQAGIDQPWLQITLVERLARDDAAEALALQRIRTLLQ
jgi:hypothetical protein